MIQLNSYEDLGRECAKGICLRNTIRSKRCSSIAKQQDCFRKLRKKLDEAQYKRDLLTSSNEQWFEISKEWFDLCNKVDERDGKDCTIWRILTKEQQRIILHDYYDEYIPFSQTIDKCHIVSRAQSKELYYDPNNVVNCCRYFHSLLDQLKHPITRKSITKDERLQWFVNARDKIKGELK